MVEQRSPKPRVESSSLSAPAKSDHPFGWSFFLPASVKAQKRNVKKHPCEREWKWTGSHTLAGLTKSERAGTMKCKFEGCLPPAKKRGGYRKIAGTASGLGITPEDPFFPGGRSRWLGLQQRCVGGSCGIERERRQKLPRPGGVIRGVCAVERRHGSSKMRTRTSYWAWRRLSPRCRGKGHPERGVFFLCIENHSLGEWFKKGCCR